MIEHFTYKKLKLLRGKRRNEELISYSKQKKDFEYRRLFIEERNLDIQVILSRKFIADLLSLTFLTLSLFQLNNPILFIVLFGITFILKIYSLTCTKKFKKIYWIFSNSLKLIDSVILNEYGINLSNN